MIHSNQPAKKSFWSQIHFPWQRRPNVLKEVIILPRTIHEATNLGAIPLPASEIHIHEVGLSQGWKQASAIAALVHEQGDSKKKANRLSSESLTSVVPYLLKPSEYDATNHCDVIMSFLATHRTIDAKDASDWEATLPNKNVLPNYQPDAEMTRHLEFLRYLVKRGVFSEEIDGTAVGEQPHSYNGYYDENRMIYSDADKPDFKAKEIDEDDLTY